MPTPLAETSTHEYKIPENPLQTECSDITNESLYQDFLEQYFEWYGWNVVREVRPSQTEYRADLLVEHDEYGWFGIETKYTNRGGRKMAEAHHQITTKYRGKMYFGHKITNWIYAPFYEFIQNDSYNSWMNEQYLMGLAQDFFQRHGVGYLSPMGKRITFEKGNAKTYIYIKPNHRAKTDIKEINRIVDLRMKQYPYTSQK
jgi:hypothetical protein